MPRKCPSNPNAICGPKTNWWQESMGLDWYSSSDQVSLFLNFGPSNSPAVDGWVSVFSDSITDSNQDFPNLNSEGWGVESIYGGDFSYWSGGFDDAGDTGNDNGIFPDDVMRTGWINDGEGLNPNLRIKGLTPNTEYQLVFFGSQPTSYAGSGAFQTKYIVGVDDESLLVLNGSVENTSNTVTIEAIANGSGQINVIVTNGNDVGGTTVGVINALVITQL